MSVKQKAEEAYMCMNRLENIFAELATAGIVEAPMEGLKAVHAELRELLDEAGLQDPADIASSEVPVKGYAAFQSGLQNGRFINNVKKK